MFGLGVWELAIILVIILVIFGAGKLPQIGAGLGKGIKNFKDSVKEEEKTLDNKATSEATKDEEKKNV